MSFWDLIWICAVIFIVFTCCGYCCQRKRRGAVLSAPVVVTSATHIAPGGYPVSQMPVGATTTYQTQGYAAPYPQQAAQPQMPMPMPMPMPGNQAPAPGVHPHMAPYAPMPAAGANMNPPSYDMAVGGMGTGAPNNTNYVKQSPYNPNF